MDANLSTSSCPSLFTSNRVLYGLLGVSMAILVVLSFMYRRTQCKANWLWGIPGIVNPVNLLITTPNRFVYATIFGAMTGDLIFYYQGIVSGTAGVVPSHSNPYARSFLIGVVTPVVITLLLSAKYLPIFACAHAPLRLLGHTIGLIYTALLVALNIYTDYINIYCPVRTNTTAIALYVVGSLPIYVCYLILLGWYSYQTALDIAYLPKKGLSSIFRPESVKARYYTNYVKKLFQVRKKRKRSPLFRVLVYLFPYMFSPLKLPLKFVSSIVVISVFLFQIAFWVVAQFLNFGVSISALWRGPENNFLKLVNLAFVNDTDTATNIYDISLTVIDGIAIILPLGPALALFLCLGLTVHLCSCVYRHISMVYRGDLSFTCIKKFEPSIDYVSASWRYAGYQIGYLFSAYLIYWLVIWLASTIIFIVYFVIRVGGASSIDVFVKIILIVVQNFLITTLWLVIVLMAQKLLIKFVFLQSKEGKFAVISNQRIFNWFAYILFFYNTFVGLVSAVLRILFSLGLGALLVMRLDRLVLMKGFEFADFGHKTYLGFLYMELVYNHPVVHAFVESLVDCVQGSGQGHRSGLTDIEATVAVNTDEAQLVGYKMYSASDEKPLSAVKVCTRNRWLVAYTLIKNPQLMELRGGKRRKEEKEKEEREKIFGKELESGFDEAAKY